MFLFLKFYSNNYFPNDREIITTCCSYTTTERLHFHPNFLNQLITVFPQDDPESNRPLITSVPIVISAHARGSLCLSSSIDVRVHCFIYRVTFLSLLFTFFSCFSYCINFVCFCTKYSISNYFIILSPFF